MEHCKACELCIVNPVCDEAIALYSEECMKVMEAFDKLGFNGAGEHISQQAK
jgi:hypothetical protein